MCSVDCEQEVAKGSYFRVDYRRGRKCNCYCNFLVQKIEYMSCRIARAERDDDRIISVAWKLKLPKDLID